MSTETSSKPFESCGAFSGLDAELERLFQFKLDPRKHICLVMLGALWGPKPSKIKKHGAKPPRKKCANIPQKYANTHKSTQIRISELCLFPKLPQFDQ